MTLNNFATSRSILAALDSSTIARLQQTWLVFFFSFFFFCVSLIYVFFSVGSASEAEGAARQRA
jgi:hypothetical protein